MKIFIIKFIVFNSISSILIFNVYVLLYNGIISIGYLGYDPKDFYFKKFNFHLQILKNSSLYLIVI